jgi:hypothetical protein
MQGTSGSQLVVADLAVGVSGHPCRVFGIHAISGAGGGTVVNMRNGIAATSTIYLTQTGTASTGATFNYGPYGILFPDGCFCDVGANLTSVLVSFRMEA